MSNASNFACLIDSKNALWNTGINSNYQLGNGTTVTSTKFNQNPYFQDVKFVKVSLGAAFGFALSEDGDLYGFGANDAGQLGMGHVGVISTISKCKSISDVVDISCGNDFAVAITRSGELFGTGKNSSYQLGLGTTNDVSIFTKIPLPDGLTAKALGCGLNATLVLMSNGSVYGCGASAVSSPVLGSAGAAMKLRLITDPPTIPIVDLIVSYYSAMYINSSGELYVWGSNSNNQIGVTGSTSVTTPTKVMDNVKTADVNNTGGFLVQNNGTAWFTGTNAFGQSALGDTTARNAWTQIPTLTNVISVFAGNSSTIFLLDNLVAVGAGMQNYGQLGNTNTTNTSNIIGITMTNPFILPDDTKPKTYPINQPAKLIATCTAQADMQALRIKGIYPTGTTAKLLFSTDQAAYKYYDKAAGQWTDADISTIETVGMSIADVHALPASKLQWLVGATFYVAISLATTDPTQTPIFSGIDAMVNLNVATPVVQAMSVDYEVKQPVGPKYFVSLDGGATWKEAVPDEITKLNDMPGGKQLKVKVVLENGLELYGMSYSWA